MANVLILGATSDMAWATAKKFASEGHNVILAARNVHALSPMVSDLQIRYEVQAEAVVFEAMDYDNHREFYNNLALKPDCVACFFGYLGEQATAETDWNEAEKIIASNYTGAVSILNIAAEYMQERGFGSIIGVSSVAGDRGRMSNYIYGSAKAGFTAYLSGLRNKLFHKKINVLTVKPGFVATKMTAELPLPKLLTATADQAANDIYQAWFKKKDIIYTRWFWRYIMLIICTIPEFIFKKLKL